MMSASAAGTGSEPLATILKGAAMTLAGLEKATGFNIRIAYTHTLRDPQVELDSGNFVPGDRPNVILVAKNSNGRTVTAQRMEFARAWFGERFLDPALSEHAQALFERGFNAFQVATLIPLPEHKPKSDKLAHDPLKALLSPPAFIPQRLKYYPLMQLADQISLAVIDIRGRLPANALRTVPRIFNSYKDTAVAIQQILKIIRSYAFNNQPTSLEKHLIASLVNPYGVDWGTPQVRALNREKYGISAPGQKLTEQLQASEKTRYLVTGTPDDKPEIIMKRDSPEKQYVFSIWQDNFNGRSSQQKRHFGLVSPHSPIGLQKSLNQALL